MSGLLLSSSPEDFLCLDKDKVLRSLLLIEGFEGVTGPEIERLSVSWDFLLGDKSDAAGLIRFLAFRPVSRLPGEGDESFGMGGIGLYWYGSRAVSSFLAVS